MGFFDNWFGMSNLNQNSKDTGMRKTPNVTDFKEEFSMETSYDTQGKDIMFYTDKGVQFYNIPNMLKILYTGSLINSGTQEIYAVVGYGDNRDWEETEYLPMQKNSQGTFEVLIERKRPGNVNVAFKDGANNWDNNMGDNYIFNAQRSEGSH